MQKTWTKWRGGGSGGGGSSGGTVGAGSGSGSDNHWRHHYPAVYKRISPIYHLKKNKKYGFHIIEFYKYLNCGLSFTFPLYFK